MIFGSKDLAQLLERTNLTIPFDQFLQKVEETYSIGKITEFFPITEGYEEANIKITTITGTFFIKIFNKKRSHEFVESYVKVLLEAEKRKIPLVRLVKGNTGNYGEVQVDTVPVWYYITFEFKGTDFSQITPSLMDMQKVTKIVAELNTLSFPILPGYDSWGSKNLVYEYNRNKEYLPKKVKDAVIPFVEQMTSFDSSSFSQSIVHGDIQRKHVLKNKKNEFCLLDLSCMRNDAKIYDLSIHLAWFCLAEDTWNKKEQIYEDVISDYIKIHALTQKELDSLPLLVHATYAAYLQKTAALIAAGDDSVETLDWYKKADKMLELSTKWGFRL